MAVKKYFSLAEKPNTAPFSTLNSLQTKEESSGEKLDAVNGEVGTLRSTLIVEGDNVPAGTTKTPISGNVEISTTEVTARGTGSLIKKEDPKVTSMVTGSLPALPIKKVTGHVVEGGNVKALK